MTLLIVRGRGRDSDLSLTLGFFRRSDLDTRPEDVEAEPALYVVVFKLGVLVVSHSQPRQRNNETAQDRKSLRMSNNLRRLPGVGSVGWLGGGPPPHLCVHKF